MLACACGLKPAPAPPPPADASGAFVRAEELRSRGAPFETLVAAYDAVLVRDPGHAEAHFRLGMLHHLRGEIADAQREYRATLARDPRHAGALNNLGAIHLEAGRTLDAARPLSEAKALRPDDPVPTANLALLWLRIGEPQRALPLLQRAQRLALADRTTFLPYAAGITRSLDAVSRGLDYPVPPRHAMSPETGLLLVSW